LNIVPQAKKTAKANPRMDIQIANRQKRHKIPFRRIRRNTRIILNALGHPEGELSILLVDDAQITEMNATFLKRKGPTNVLAFPMQEGWFAGLSPNLLGDVVISVDTAEREGRTTGLGLEERFTQLLVHGILHLCGYDHEQDAVGARRMAVKSRALIRKIKGEPEKVKPKTVRKTSA
jgi:probable rRNA maturation factor